MAAPIIDEHELLAVIMDRLAGAGRTIDRADVELILDLELEYLAQRGLVSNDP